MSALPIPLKDASIHGRILELYNASYALDPYHDRLASVGYDVINASSYAEALTLAQHRQPELIIVYDNPDGGIDALKWLEMQHTARLGWLAAVPLMILADASRAAELRPHELSDRVTVVLRRSDTLNQLSRTVKRLLNVNRW
jgi:DNA-binding response OmpR family regulator